MNLEFKASSWTASWKGKRITTGLQAEVLRALYQHEEVDLKEWRMSYCHRVAIIYRLRRILLDNQVPFVIIQKKRGSAVFLLKPTKEYKNGTEASNPSKHSKDIHS